VQDGQVSGYRALLLGRNVQHCLQDNGLDEIYNNEKRNTGEAREQKCGAIHPAQARHQLDVAKQFRALRFVRHANLRLAAGVQGLGIHRWGKD